MCYDVKELVPVMRMAGTLDLPEELGALNNLTMVKEELRRRRRD